MLETGMLVPDLPFVLDDGSTHRLSDFHGQKIVLYFYPKDNTPGCTKEACSFRDYNAEIEKEGALIIGVSPQDEATHQKFRAKQSLNFRLAADHEAKLAEAFGVWQEKKMYGRTYFGNVRTTFLIDENGHILKVYQKVKAENHGAEVLKDLQEMNGK